MKITDIKSYIVSANNDNWVYIKVFTDENITGVGECSLETRELTVVQAVEELKRYVLGRDPLQTEQIFYTCYRDEYWGACPVLVSALSALDCALWDIKGKAFNMPVYQLLGGKFRDRIRVYANRWFLGAKTDAELVRKAEETVGKGYTALKWDPFVFAEHTITAKGLRDVVEQVKAVRNAVGPDVDILIEGHGRFNVYTAVNVANELAPFKPMFFEEPVLPENLDALAEVREKSPIPIASGERWYTKYDFRAAFRKKAVDIAQPDLRITGGITEGKKIAALAEAEFIPIAPHNIHGKVGTAMSLHLAASIPNALILEYSSEDVSCIDRLFDHPLKPVNGYMSIEDRPGLGIDFDEAVALQHPYRTISMVQTLFSNNF